MIGFVVFGLLFTAAWLLVGRYGRIESSAKEEGAAKELAHGINDPALMLDLAAAMLEAGQPMRNVLTVLSQPCGPDVRAAIQRAAAALDLGASWNSAWQLASDKAGKEGGRVVTELASALAFAGATGAPSAKLLYAHAAQFRRRNNRAAEKRAASLGVKLVIPLGVCALPAFVCLGVMPVLFALVPSLG